MRDSLTELILILDTSSSMAGIQPEMEKAVNAFLNEQRNTPGECRVTLTKFDTLVRPEFSGRDISRVEPINLHANGWTALYDAVAQTVTDVGRRLAATPESDRPAKVICVIVTDGDENQSVEYSRFKDGQRRIKDMVEHQKNKYNWVFTFLGADHDAVLAAKNIGIDATHSSGYTKTFNAVQNVGSVLSDKISGIRGMSAEQYASTNMCALYDDNDKALLNANDANPTVATPKKPRASRAKTNSN